MKNNILYINACVRPDSRTEELARELLDGLDIFGADVQTIMNEAKERISNLI